MRKLFAIIMLVIVATIYSSATEVVNDTTSITFTKVYNDVKDGISALATSLKAPAEHVYTILVKQQVVNAVTFSLLLILSIIGFVILYKSIKFINQPNPKDTRYSRLNNDEGWIILPVITGLVSLVLFIVGITHIDTILTGFLNPEYGAIKDIISIVK